MDADDRLNDEGGEGEVFNNGFQKFFWKRLEAGKNVYLQKETTVKKI